MSLFVLSALTALFPGPHASPAETAFAKLQTLVGIWEGKMGSNPYKVTYRMTGSGSALVETQFEGSPHEMTTVYTMDGPKLVVTHYCAAHNTPHMKFVPGAAKDSITFSVVSVGNLKPDTAFMKTVTHKFASTDHLISTWTAGGPKEKAGTVVLDVTRVKS